MPVSHVVTLFAAADLPAELIPALFEILEYTATAYSGIETFSHGADLGLYYETVEYAITSAFRDENASTESVAPPEHRRINTEIKRVLAKTSIMQFTAPPIRPHSA